MIDLWTRPRHTALCWTHSIHVNSFHIYVFFSIQMNGTENKNVSQWNSVEVNSESVYVCVIVHVAYEHGTLWQDYQSVTISEAFNARLSQAMSNQRISLIHISHSH